MILSFLLLALAFESERQIPTIVIARRTISPINVAPFSPLSDPNFFFEKFLKEKSPIVVRADISQTNNNEEEKKHYFKPIRRITEERRTIGGGNFNRRRSLESKVKDNSSFSEDIKKINKGSFMHTMGLVILFVSLLVASGVVGYYLGKAAESKNYVRVPSVN